MASIPVVHDSTPQRALREQVLDFSERLGSAILLVAASPVLCASAAAVAVLSRRTPLIAHRRVGWRGSTLWMLKLRTMWDRDTPRAPGWIEYIDDPAGPHSKQATDPRVPHAFARFCRRHSLDELPQLFHVVRGEMSLVGPRPLTAAELSHYYDDDAREVLECKPGIAGLWQIHGRNRLTYAERREFDLQLVRSRSLGMYLRVLVGALREVWHGGNAW